MAGIMEGKRGLVVGVANHRSIAWGIAQRLHDEGAEIGFTFAGPSTERYVRTLAERMDAAFVEPCNVSSDDEIARVCDSFAGNERSIDFLVHAVAFANGDELKNGFLNTSRAGFHEALDVTSYSIVAFCRNLKPHMREGGSIVSLSYLGSERVCAGYNVLGVAKATLEASCRYLAADLGPSGIRVNVISAGPVRTLAAFGLPNFKEMVEKRAGQSPLRRNITAEDVGNSALFLLSDLSSATTGETFYVDAGYNIMGTWAEGEVA